MRRSWAISIRARPGDVLERSALQLFITRMTEWRSGSQRPGEFSTIAAICRRLDGIPLAIEFATLATCVIQRLRRVMDDDRLAGSLHDTREWPSGIASLTCGPSSSKLGVGDLQDGELMLGRFPIGPIHTRA
jgi:hypothetical protein